MRIATFNVNNVNKRLPVLLAWLEAAEPDVVCLQELKATDAQFPADSIETAGYGAVWRGQSAWNGVAILARGREPVLTRTELPGDPADTQTLHVPFRVVKRGGRKEMQLPDGAPPPRRTDNTLVKALARAFRWKRMLESGDFATIAELAERGGIAPSYMTRVLRLTLLAPEIVEAILNGRHGPEVTLSRVLEPFPMRWQEQLVTFA